jgi:SpoVK/Ycf46/Vps4 family AAA+-type ATPase
LTKPFSDYDIIVFYNISAGLTFPNETMKEAFKTAVGLKRDSSAPPQKSPLSKAKNQMLSEMEVPDTDFDEKRPSYILPRLEQILKSNAQKSLVVIEYVETIAPTGDYASLHPDRLPSLVTLQRWAIDRDIMNTDNLVVLTTKSLLDLAPVLYAPTSKIEVIDIPLPDYKERLEFLYYLDEIRKIHGEPGLTFEDGLKHDRLAKLTAGLNRMALEDIVLRTEEKNAPICVSDVRQRKQEILETESAGLLKVFEPQEGFEVVGGLGHIKDYLHKIVSLQEDAACPMGILFLGPPGTGKTVVAKALAKETHWNYAEMGDIREKWVGQSERNLSKVLSLIESLVPVIVFIDEIDQAEGSRGEAGDSGVSRRIFAKLLSFMSETRLRGKVLWIGASNRPDLLDAALRRPGRFDDKLIFLPPDEAGRADILRVMFERKLKISHQIKSFAAAAQMTDGLTGAELEVIANRSRRFATRNGHDKVTEDDLLACINDFIPSRDPEMYQFMTLIAVREANSWEMLPQQFHELVKDRKQLDDEIYELKRRLGLMRY